MVHLKRDALSPNVARIAFYNKLGGEEITHVKVAIYETALLKEMSIFKEAQLLNDDEELIHTWSTRQSTTALIKYSDSEKTNSFVLYSKKGIHPSMLTQCQLSLLGDFIDYIKEVEFTSTLSEYIVKSVYDSVDYCRRLGMNEEKCSLLMHHRRNMQRLLKAGMPIEELLPLEAPTLEKLRDPGVFLEKKFSQKAEQLPRLGFFKKYVMHLDQKQGSNPAEMLIDEDGSEDLRPTKKEEKKASKTGIFKKLLSYS